MTTTAQKALELILPIPEEDFITHSFTNGSSKCCVQGHVQRLTSTYSNDFSGYNCTDFEHQEGFAFNLRIKSKSFLQGSDIATVNNGAFGKYNQPTPKQRVVALLDDMIKAGYVIAFVLLLASCGASRYDCGNGKSYFLSRRNNGIEKYTYMVRSWPQDIRMSTYKSMPVKESTYRRYYFDRRPKRQ